MSEPDQPPRPDGREPDSDQLPLEDTLLDRGVDDALEEGYSPPERPRTNRWGETPLEESLGESHDRRLAQEEPEVWEKEYAPPRGSEPDRAGRLEAADDGAPGSGGQDVLASDVGVAGGGAGAEEAAVHLVPEDAATEEPAPLEMLDPADRTLDDDETGPEPSR